MYVPPVTVCSFLPRIFARVHRAFTVRPLVQFQVRFSSISLLSSSSTVNNSEYFLMVPAGCNSSFPVSSHQGFFLGCTYPLQLALWHLIYPTCVSFPFVVRHSPLRYWALPILFLFPKEHVRWFPSFFSTHALCAPLNLFPHSYYRLFRIHLPNHFLLFPLHADILCVPSLGFLCTRSL